MTIKTWIYACDRTHTECQNTRSKLPKRVLQVANGKIQLIESEGRTGDYITLSHCWGAPGSQLKTTPETIEKWKEDIPFEELSQSYKDAVVLTRNFRINFLWIDSLCIVQGDTQEWEAESGRMASVYENSYLTICATRASDGSGGLFSDRQLTTTRSIPYLLGSLDDSLFQYVPEAYPIYGRWEFEHHKGDKGGNEYSPNTIEPLNRRGWAFQERLLSRRTIEFLSAEIVWQCNRTQRCECTQIDRMSKTSQDTESTVFFKNALSPVFTDSSTQLSEDSPFGSTTWESIVTAYTSLQLTYPSDKLPALSDLAQRMARISPHEDFQTINYVAGLWSNCLPRQLS